MALAPPLLACYVAFILWNWELNQKAKGNRAGQTLNPRWRFSSDRAGMQFMSSTVSHSMYALLSADACATVFAD